MKGEPTRKREPFHMAAVIPFFNPRYPKDKGVVLIDAGLHIPKAMVIHEVNCEQIHAFFRLS